MIDIKNKYSYPSINYDGFKQEYIKARLCIFKNPDYNINLNNLNFTKEFILIDDYFQINKYNPKSLIHKLSIINSKKNKLATEIQEIRRYYEIHKKIYTMYMDNFLDFDLSSEINNPKDLILFSYTLQKYFTIMSDYNFLSTSIKVNDNLANEYPYKNKSLNLFFKTIILHELNLIFNK